MTSPWKLSICLLVLPNRLAFRRPGCWREVRLSEGDRSRCRGSGRRQRKQPQQPRIGANPGHHEHRRPRTACPPRSRPLRIGTGVPSRQLRLSAQRSWFAVTGEAPTAACGPAMRIRDAPAAGLGSLPCGMPGKTWRARPLMRPLCSNLGSQPSSFLVGGADRHRCRGSFRIPRWQMQPLFFFWLSNQNGAERLCRRTLNVGVAMQYRKELLPLAVMGLPECGHNGGVRGDGDALKSDRLQA
jgi:hypothetical protein